MMTPPLAAQDKTYGGTRDADTLGYLTLKETLTPQLVDEGNRMLVEFRVIVQAASLRATRSVRASALRVHVGHVVSLSANEHMAWSNTPRMVTAMEEVHAVRNGTHDVFVGGSVGALAVPTSSDDPVSGFVSVAEPPPASGSRLDPRPESLFLKHEVSVT
jgi:hypothetical protein